MRYGISVSLIELYLQAPMSCVSQVGTQIHTYSSTVKHPGKLWTKLIHMFGFSGKLLLFMRSQGKGEEGGGQSLLVYELLRMRGTA